MIIALNILIFAAAIYAQSSLLARFDFFGFIPNIILILLVAFAFFRRVYEAYLFAFLSGLLLDIISAGPFGVYTSTFMLTVFAANFLIDEDNAKISNVFAGIFMGAVALVFYGFLVAYIFFSVKDFYMSGLYFCFGQVAVTTGVFILVFPLLKKFFLWEEGVDKLRSG